MNSTTIEMLGRVSERPLPPRRKAQPFAIKTRTTCGKSEPESRLWKVTSTVISPVKRGFESGLFLIASSFGIGATVYGMDQLVAFIHSDSLARTITALLR
jgi:hypothetical protein